MKIRIKACLNVKGFTWYNDCIGRVFTAEWEIRNKLMTGRLLVDGKVVLRGDCDIVDEDAVDDLPVSGNFSFVNGKLSFTMHTKNVHFAEVKRALLHLKEEIERQIENEKNCPYYES